MNDDNRYEIKFILNEDQLTEALYFLKMMGFFSPYPCRSINSLYYDSVDFKSVKDNLSGISHRHKVRLRWYDENNSNFSPAILEIKKRNGRLGSKSKYTLAHLTKDDILLKNTHEVSNQIFQYIYRNHEYDPVLNDAYIPVLFVNYLREYYENSKGLRVTIDKSINFRNISLNNTVKYYKPLLYHEYIMEIKFPIEMKDDVSDAIRHLTLTPKRHSKYLAGMSKLGYTIYI